LEELPEVRLVAVLLVAALLVVEPRVEALLEAVLPEAATPAPEGA
jgi:hypothetical protein